MILNHPPTSFTQKTISRQLCPCCFYKFGLRNVYKSQKSHFNAVESRAWNLLLLHRMSLLLAINSIEQILLLLQLLKAWIYLRLLSANLNFFLESQHFADQTCKTTEC